MRELPRGWQWRRLDELAAQQPSAITDGPFGSNLKSSDYVDTGARVIRLGNIGLGRFVDKDRSFVSMEKFSALRKHEAVAGDLVIAALAEPVGRACLVPPNLGPTIVKADCIRFRPGESIDVRFLMYALNSPQGLAQTAASAHGLGRLRVNLGEIRALNIPVPPLDVQRRIVAKLDALLAQSRAAREQLAAVPDLVETYRQSVLAAAFRGDLTADWRKKNPNVEPASKLLERIRIERRKAWEAAEFAKGKPPKDDKWKSKYAEPESASGEDLALPNVWCVEHLEGLCDPDRGIPYGIVQTGDAVEHGVPTVRCGDIKGFDIDPRSLKLVKTGVDAAYPRTKLRGGEVLLAIRGSVGEVAVVGQSLVGANISREVAMIPPLQGVAPRFLMYFLKSPLAQATLFRHVKGVAQQGINLADVRTLAVPLASLEEQREVVRHVDALLSRGSVLAGGVTDAGQMLPVLDRGLLAKAFEGELLR